MTIVNVKEFFYLAGIENELPNLNTLHGKYKDGITDKQKEFLRKLGIGTTGIHYKGQASIVIDIALARKEKGLATPGQMRALHKMGCRNVGKVTYRSAFQLLSDA